MQQDLSATSSSQDVKDLDKDYSLNCMKHSLKCSQKGYQYRLKKDFLRYIKEGKTLEEIKEFVPEKVSKENWIKLCNYWANEASQKRKIQLVRKTSIKRTFSSTKDTRKENARLHQRLRRIIIK